MPTVMFIDPSTGEHFAHDLPAGVDPAVAQKQMNDAYASQKQSNTGMDMLKSGASGLAQGGLSAVKMVPQLAVMGGMMLNKGIGAVGKAFGSPYAEGDTEGMNEKLGAFANKYLEEPYDSAVHALHADYAPATTAGRYTQAIGAGVGSSLVPISRAASLGAKAGQAGIGAVSGALPQYINENKTFGAQSDVAGRLAALLPGLLNMTGRAFLPRAADKAALDLQKTFSATPKAELDAGFGKMQDTAADPNLTPISPGQAFGPDHGIVSVMDQTKTPEMQAFLAQQLANSKAKGGPGSVYGDAYEASKNIPLARSDALDMAGQVRAIKNQLGLATGIPASKGIDRFAGYLENNGTKSQGPGTIKTTQNYVAPDLADDVAPSPMPQGTSRLKLLGLNEPDYRVEVHGQRAAAPPNDAPDLIMGEPTHTFVPGEMQTDPVSTVGQAHSVRQFANDSGNNPDLAGAIRKQISAAIGNKLKENPTYATADSMYQQYAKNADDVALGRGGVGAGDAPTQSTPPHSIASLLHPLTDMLQGDVPAATTSILKDTSGRGLQEALRFNMLTQRYGPQVAAMMAAKEVAGSGGVPPQQTQDGN